MDDPGQGTVPGFVAQNTPPSSPSTQPPQDAPKKSGISPIIIIFALLAIGVVIIFIFIVIIGLFSLGTFGSSGLPTSCLASSGFQCSNLVSTGGVLIFTFGQTTGINWHNVTLFTVPTGQKFSQTQGSSTYPSSLTIPSLPSGQTTNVTLSGKSSTWSGYAGTVWAQYSYNGKQYYIQVASVIVR